MQCLLLRRRKLRTKIRDYHVPAGEHTGFRTHLKRRAVAQIRDLDRAAARRIADVRHAGDNAVQAHAHRRLGPVEPRIVDAGADDVLDSAPRHSFGNEASHQQPRDRRIPIGEVQLVGSTGIRVALRRVAHARDSSRRKLHALEPGIFEGPAVECRNRVGADPEPAMCPRLIESYYRGVGLDQVAQEVAVADLRESQLLFRAAETWQIVLRPSLNTHDILARSRRQRYRGNELSHGYVAPADREPVLVERLTIEERRAPKLQMIVEPGVLDLLRQSLDVDADVADQSGGGCAVGTRAVDLKGAAVDDPQTVRRAELVALGMATKIVVILENQHARPTRRTRAKEMCCRKATDPAAHDDQVVRLAEIGTRLRGRPFAQSVHGLERSRMTAA